MSDEPAGIELQASTSSTTSAVAARDEKDNESLLPKDEKKSHDEDHKKKGKESSGKHTKKAKKEPIASSVDPVPDLPPADQMTTNAMLDSVKKRDGATSPRGASTPVATPDKKATLEKAKSSSDGKKATLEKSKSLKASSDKALDVLPVPMQRAVPSTAKRSFLTVSDSRRTTTSGNAGARKIVARFSRAAVL